MNPENPFVPVLTSLGLVLLTVGGPINAAWNTLVTDAERGVAPTHTLHTVAFQRSQTVVRRASALTLTRFRRSRQVLP